MNHAAPGDAHEGGAQLERPPHRREGALVVLLLLLTAVVTWFVLPRVDSPETPSGAGGPGITQDGQTLTAAQGRLVVNQTSLMRT